MPRKIEVEILGDSRSLERAFLRSSKGGRAFIGSMRNVGFAAAGALTAFSVAAVKSVQSASNLEEQVNKTNVVFGDSAAEIQAWSRTTASAFGISRRAALEAAGGFGQMFQSAGLNEQLSAKMSQSITELGSDLASFNNIDPTEMLDKLRSGLAGEAEPLRRFGIFISEASVKAEAYRVGIAKVGEELTDQQKVQARYSLILSQTSKAQGDFARTSDSLANAQRRVRAQLEDAAAGIGQKVLPIVADAADKFAGFIDEFSKARGVEAKFEVVVDGLQNIGRDIFEKVREAVSQIDWDAAVTSVREGLLRAVTRIGEVLGSIDYGEIGRTIGRSIGDSLEAVAAYLSTVDWSKVGGTIVKGLIDFLSNVPWKRLIVGVFKLIDAAIDAAASLLIGAARELGGQIMKGIGEGLERAENFVLRKLLEFVNKVLGITGFLGRFDPFKGVRENVQKRLAEMTGDTEIAAKSMDRSLQGIKDRKVTVTVDTKTTVNGEDTGGSAQPLSKAATSILSVIDKTTAFYKSKLDAAIKRGQKQIDDSKAAFPDLMARMQLDLDEAELTAGFGDDRAVLGRIERAIVAQMKVEGETTELAQLLFDTRKEITGLSSSEAEQRKTEQRTAFENLIDSLTLKIEGAADTAGFKDDLRRNMDLQDAIKQQIKIEGRTTDLVRQLRDARRDRAAIETQMREQAESANQARQFKALGFDATGNKPTPTVANLEKQLAALTKRTKGTDLEKRFATIAQGVGRVLDGEFGKVTESSREKVRDIFAGIRGEFDKESNKGPLTTGRKLDIHGMIGDLGLDVSTSKQLASRLSRISPDGTVSSRGRSAFGQQITTTAQPIVVHSELYVDGKKMASNTTKHQQKTKMRSATQTRGPFGGV